jgi:hypothetical protein
VRRLGRRLGPRRHWQGKGRILGLEVSCIVRSIHRLFSSRYYVWYSKIDDNRDDVIGYRNGGLTIDQGWHTNQLDSCMLAFTARDSERLQGSSVTLAALSRAARSKMLTPCDRGATKAMAIEAARLHAATAACLC